MARSYAALTVLGLCALIASATVASPAKLGERCGGLAGPACDGDLWCERPADKCFVADLPGVCAKANEMCAALYDPVCGCDGKTYGNDCERRSKRMQLKHKGTC